MKDSVLRSWLGHCGEFKLPSHTFRNAGGKGLPEVQPPAGLLPVGNQVGRDFVWPWREQFQGWRFPQSWGQYSQYSSPAGRDGDVSVPAPTGHVRQHNPGRGSLHLC